MIVKNEAPVLARCLRSVHSVVDEIIIVDTGSVDSTIEVAEGFGPLIIRSGWKDDFSYSRNLSIQEASGEWILWLDADDVAPAESLPVISALKQEQPDKVFGFIVRNEKPGKTGTEFVQARMFPNRPDIYFERRIHEQMMFSALRAGLRLVETKAIIEHHGYADPAAMGRKARRNLRLLLDDYEDYGPDAVMAVEIADSYSIAGDTLRARQWYEKTLALPECEAMFPHIASQAYLGLGAILNKDNRHFEAIQQLQNALRLSPGRVDALFSLGVAYDLCGRNNEAIDCFYTIIRAPSAPLMVGIDFREARIKSLLRLERLLVESGRDGELLTIAREALAQWSHRPEMLNMAGRAFVRGNMLMEALHAFEKSLKIDVANNIDAYIGLCRIYALACKNETARQTIGAIRPLYWHVPRYWALYRQVMGDLPESEVPDGVVRGEIDKEEAAIRRMFPS